VARNAVMLAAGLCGPRRRGDRAIQLVTPYMGPVPDLQGLSPGDQSAGLGNIPGAVAAAVGLA